MKFYKEIEFFENIFRIDYFKAVMENSLIKSLIFIDPDNGLQVKKSNKKHILYAELLDIYNIIDYDSILMIYQHSPRENHDEYLKRRTNELNKLTNAAPTLSPIMKSFSSF